MKGNNHDLGYCAALRTAATVLADHPIFGRFCFGSDERTSAGRIEVIPWDGLRRRFHARLSGHGGIADGGWPSAQLDCHRKPQRTRAADTSI